MWINFVHATNAANHYATLPTTGNVLYKENFKKAKTAYVKFEISNVVVPFCLADIPLGQRNIHQSPPTLHQQLHIIRRTSLHIYPDPSQFRTSA